MRPDRATVPLQLDRVSAGYDGAMVFSCYSRSFGTGIYAIMGGNGSGKSTLLKCICGVVPLGTGQVRIAGFDIARQPSAAKRLLSYMPSEALAYPFMTGFDLSHLVRGAKGLPATPELETLAGRFGMDAHLSKPFSDMSAGMRRKAFLIAALLGSPRVLLLDEPSDAIDAGSQAVLIEILASRRPDSAILIATHDPALVSGLGAEVVAWPPRP